MAESTSPQPSLLAPPAAGSIVKLFQVHRLICLNQASRRAGREATLSSKSPCLALIHTSPSLTPLFTDLCRVHLPEASIFHMVDESLIQDTVRAGFLRKATIRRVAALVDSAVEAGADAVLVTCSSIGVAVERAAERQDVPVVRVDAAMAEKAVRQSKTIGVLATLRTTLEPTTDLLRRKAAAAGRDITFVECLCEEAFPAVMAGDTETHDRLLRKALTEDLKDVETIVLAQASMARVVSSLPEGAIRAEVLSSPALGVLSVRQALGLAPVG